MRPIITRAIVALTFICFCFISHRALAADLGSPEWQPTPENPVGWRGDGSGRYPGANPPTTWSRKDNVLWAARMPAQSVGSPIIVGDKIFLMAEPCDLVCLDKKTGKVLWMRCNHEAETITDEDRKANPDYAANVDPLVPKLQPLDDELVAAVNADDQGKLESVRKQKEDLDRKLVKALTDIDKKRFERYWGQAVFGFAGTTPTSDGKHIGIFLTTGVTAVYDLDGKRLWLDRGKGTGAEHGNFSSPLLIGGELCVWAGEMRGYDFETGKLLFKNPGQSDNTYGSMFRLRVGNDLVAAFQSGYFTRIRDGKPIFTPGAFGNAISTPIVEGNAIIAWVGYPRQGKSELKVFKIPASTDVKSLEPQYSFKYNWAEDQLPEGKAHPFDRNYTASPLLVDGLLYQLTEGAGLSVHDVATGAQIYTKVLDMKPHTEYWNWAGASASPTLGGKYIYLMDNQGTCIVIKPGKEYVEVAKNFLQEGGDGKQAQNLATPVFEGSRMYYRTPGFLYCFGEK